MAKSREYFDLMASLPALPYFEKAERNPLNRSRLWERLRMLEEEDLGRMRRAAEFLAWQHQPVARTDAKMVALYTNFIRRTCTPLLREMVEYRMNQRTVLAALRRRRKGRPAPGPEEVWGAGPWTLALRQNWADPDFKLAAVFPWLPEARSLLEAGNAIELDRLLFRKEWRWLESLAMDSEFSIEALLKYLFQWDILDLWLSYDAPAAEERFEELVAEVSGEHYKLFN